MHETIVGYRSVVGEQEEEEEQLPSSLFDWISTTDLKQHGWHLTISFIFSCFCRPAKVVMARNILLTQFLPGRDCSRLVLESHFFSFFAVCFSLFNFHVLRLPCCRSCWLLILLDAVKALGERTQSNGRVYHIDNVLISKSNYSLLGRNCDPQHPPWRREKQQAHTMSVEASVRKLGHL